jgi:hypothetical protein
MKKEAASPSEKLVPHHITTPCHNPEDHSMNVTTYFEQSKRIVQIYTGLHFSSVEIPAYNKITLLIATARIPVTVITYRCVSTCLLSAVITMSEQVVPSAVVQSITFKFLTNGNVKSAKILIRLRAQIGNETFSRTPVHDSRKSFKDGRTEVENTRRLHILQGKLWPPFSGRSRRFSSIF